ncbi:proteasome subunit beta [Pseudomonas sp. CDFA 602]|uniref:proteasome subunit beta n=1 Tax=Pseudomonas californiensis TaxID=2829823 RepID=UPI001E364582|nr:proteasome subunit beta [Pseudomonas californiensis]MCD5994163.1 proteasome subunit beta [Pseudomonas californiensis]MCD5999738.1 proteasome subunit beta [Pseudomonas californiensis]
MTTIAYKDGVIAYDTRQTRNGSIVSDDCSKCEIVDGVSFFLSGCVCDEKGLIAAYFGTPSKDPLECSGFVVDNGKLMLVGHDDKTGVWKQPLDLSNPDAIGSGSAYALAAMDMGASAEDAVRAAMRRDIYTGGVVRCVAIESVES